MKIKKRTVSADGFSPTEVLPYPMKVKRQEHLLPFYKNFYIKIPSFSLAFSRFLR